MKQTAESVKPGSFGGREKGVIEVAREKWVGFGFEGNECGETRNKISAFEKKEKLKREKVSGA